MTLVAGIDSSTQSCKVVVRDADTGELVRRAAPPHPGRHRGRPGRWWTALRAGGRRGRRARRRRRGRRRRPAARHGLPRRGRRGRPARAAVERHPLARGAAARPGRASCGRRAGVGRRGRASCRSRRSRSPSCAGSPSTSRTTRPATAAVCLPHDWLTWRLARRRRARRAGHRPRRRQRHRLLVPGDRRYRPDLLELGARPRRRCCPRCSAPAEPAGPHAGRSRLLGPGRGRQRRRRARPRRRAGRRRRLDRHLRGRLARSPTAPTRGPDRHGRRLRRRHRRATCRWCAPSTPPGCSTPPRAARRRPRRASPSWRSPRPPGAGGLVLVPYLEGERTPNRPDATGALHGLTLRTTHRRTPGPRGGRGAAVRAGRRRSTRCARRACRRAGPAGRRRGALGGGPADRPGGARPAGASCPRRASTSPTAPPGRPPGCCRGEPPEWEPAGTVVREADPTPAVRARYAEVRDLTAARV